MTEIVSDEQLKTLIKWHNGDGTRRGELTTEALRELEATRALLSTLKAERDAARQQIVDALYSPGTVRTEPLAELLDALLTMYRIVDRCKSAAEAERDALAKALEPFAEAADDLDEEHPNEWHLWEHAAAMSLSAGDLRRARSTLKGDAP